jgi:hypothetical protein
MRPHRTAATVVCARQFPMSQLPSAIAAQSAAIDAPVGGPALRAFVPRDRRTALTALAVAAAALAAWVTARADFLAYPGWLAAQKADFILGPIGVGLYWVHRRPGNRFGVLLIVLGLLGVPSILESSSDPTLFAVGVLAEDPIYVMTTVVILAFPSGRLAGRPERVVLAALVLVVAVVTVSASHLAPGLSISGCRDACPETRLGIAAPRTYVNAGHVLGLLPVLVALGAAAVVVSRFATGTPPRRRALAIGSPIAVLYLLSEAAYRARFVFAPDGLAPGVRWIQDGLQWTLAGSRGLIWFGYLFALIGAQLFAGRVLREVVGASMRRPSTEGLERLLRAPLGDPGLRIGSGAGTTVRGTVPLDGDRR